MCQGVCHDILPALPVSWSKREIDRGAAEHIWRRGREQIELYVIRVDLCVPVEAFIRPSDSSFRSGRKAGGREGQNALALANNQRHTDTINKLAKCKMKATSFLCLVQQAQLPQCRQQRQQHNINSKSCSPNVALWNASMPISQRSSLPGYESVMKPLHMMGLFKRVICHRTQWCKEKS